MAGKYVNQEYRKGDMSFASYFSHVVEPSVNDKKWMSPLPQKEVMVRGQDGKMKMVESWRAGVCFASLSKTFEEKGKTVSPTVLGTALPNLVEWLPAMSCSFKHELYEGLTGKEVTIPLSLPCQVDDDRTMAVINNTAIAWITNYAFAVNPTYSHTCNMYMSAIHSILVTLMNKETTEEQYKQQLSLLLMLLAVAKSFFQRYKESRGPISALVDDTKASDMTQRCVAFEIHMLLQNEEGSQTDDTEEDNIWDTNALKERQLSVFQTALYRWYKRPPSNKNFVTNLPTGIFSCLIVIPIICRYGFRDRSSPNDVNLCYAEIVKSTTDIIASSDSKTVDNLQTVVTHRLLKKMGVNKSEAIATAFYKYATENFTESSNFRELGLIDSVAFPFNVDVSAVLIKGSSTIPVRVVAINDKSVVDGKSGVDDKSGVDCKSGVNDKSIVDGKFKDTMTTAPTAVSDVDCQPGLMVDNKTTSDVKSPVVTSDIADVKSTGIVNNVSIVGLKFETANPAQWSGIRLLEKGKYQIRSILCGGASYGKGNTNRQNLQAVVRFTLGPEIFPPGIRGFSSAGMEYNPKFKKFVDTGKPLDLTKPVLLTIDETKFTIGDNVYVQKLEQYSLLIAFQYCHLKINKLPTVVEQPNQKQPSPSGPFGKMVQTLSSLDLKK